MLTYDTVYPQYSIEEKIIQNNVYPIVEVSYVEVGGEKAGLFIITYNTCYLNKKQLLIT